MYCICIVYLLASREWPPQVMTIDTAHQMYLNDLNAKTLDSPR